jgi:hypothetical protein
MNGQYTLMKGPMTDDLAYHFWTGSPFPILFSDENGQAVKMLVTVTAMRRVDGKKDDVQISGVCYMDPSRRYEATINVNPYGMDTGTGTVRFFKAESASQMS